MNSEIHELTPRVRFKASYETQLLMKRLRQLAETKDTTQIVTYKELSSICGRNVQKTGRCLLVTARNAVEREFNCLLCVVDGVGIRLMEPSEQVTIGARCIHEIRNKGKRALERMGRVEYEKLTGDEKRSHNANASLIGAQLMFASNAARKEIEARVTDRPLQIGETVSFFSGKK